MKILYRTKAIAVGGREGRVRSADGVLDLGLALPKELGGAGKQATNPEQLFAAGYAACFESAVRHVAKRQKRPLGSTEVTAEVGIGPRDDGGFGLSVALQVVLGGIDQPTADALVAEAHQVCPYSHAIGKTIAVQTETRVV